MVVPDRAWSPRIHWNTCQQSRLAPVLAWVAASRSLLDCQLRQLVQIVVLPQPPPCRSHGCLGDAGCDQHPAPPHASNQKESCCAQAIHSAASCSPRVGTACPTQWDWVCSMDVSPLWALTDYSSMHQASPRDQLAEFLSGSMVFLQPPTRVFVVRKNALAKVYEKACEMQQQGGGGGGGRRRTGTSSRRASASCSVSDSSSCARADVPHRSSSAPVTNSAAACSDSSGGSCSSKVRVSTLKGI